MRQCAAGPVVVRHTFPADSSHAPFLDSLAGMPDPGSVLTVHSFELYGDHEVGTLPWTASDFDRHGRPLGLSDTPWRLMYTHGGTEIRCFDRERMIGIFITVGPVKYWEYYAPMLAFLSWCAAAQGAVMVHAGCVGTVSSMGIVGGPSGTGKSTTVLLGMRAGLVSCGDDYMWLQPAASGIKVRLVYRTLKTLVGAGIIPQRFERTVRVGHAQKDVYWLAMDASVTGAGDSSGLIPVASLDVGWLLAAAGDPRPPTALDLLAALLPSTLLRIPGDEQQVSALLRGVVARLTLFSLPRTGDYEALTRALKLHTGAPASDDRGHHEHG
jgi:hypothetical protein